MVASNFDAGTRQCEHCWQRLPHFASFCSRCGHAVTSTFRLEQVARSASGRESGRRCFGGRQGSIVRFVVIGAAIAAGVMSHHRKASSSQDRSWSPAPMGGGGWAPPQVPIAGPPWQQQWGMPQTPPEFHPPQTFTPPRFDKRGRWVGSEYDSDRQYPRQAQGNYHPGHRDR